MLGCFPERAHGSDGQQSTQRKLRLDDLQRDGGPGANRVNGAKDQLGRVKLDGELVWPNAGDVAGVPRKSGGIDCLQPAVVAVEIAGLDWDGQRCLAETRTVMLPHGQSDRIRARRAGVRSWRVATLSGWKGPIGKCRQASRTAQ